MTLDEAVTVVIRRLGNRVGIESQVAEAIRLSQIEVEQGTDKPWFLLRERVPVQQVDNEPARIELPEDFLSDWEDGLLEFLDEDKWWALEKKDFRSASAAQATLFPAPAFYSLLNSSILLFPEPEPGMTFRWSYWGHEPQLTDGNSTNNWLTFAPEILISMAGLKEAPYVEAEAKLAAFQATLQTALQALKIQTQHRIESGQVRFMEYGQ